MKTDMNWLRLISQLEVIIELNGIHHTLEGMLQAIESMEEEMLRDNSDFEGSPHHKNIEHQKQVIEYAMSAFDLNDIFGSAEARKVAMKRFEDNMKMIRVAV